MDVDEISEQNLGIQPRWATIGGVCAYAMSTNISCASLHARIQGFSSGGGGPGQSYKKALFISPQLILQKSNGQFQRNLSFFKVPEGVQHIPGGRGVQLFPGWGPIAYSL